MRHTQFYKKRVRGKDIVGVLTTKVNIATATTSEEGVSQPDGTTITIDDGVISAVQPEGADPTATATTDAVNGSAETFMRSDAAPAVDIQSLLDDAFGTTEGLLLVRGSDGWEALSPGTSGTVLTSQGSGALPVWS